MEEQLEDFPEETEYDEAIEIDLDEDTSESNNS